MTGLKIPRLRRGHSTGPATGPPGRGAAGAQGLAFGEGEASRLEAAEGEGGERKFLSFAVDGFHLQ